MAAQGADGAARRGPASWEQVYLCPPSPALQGDWLGELLRRPGEPTVVMLTVALGDREHVLAHLPATHLVQGMLALVSYAGALPGEELPLPGTVYWFPPGAHPRFAGPTARVHDVLRALDAGGMPVAEAKGEVRVSARTGAVVMPHLVALEAAGWSLEALRRGELLRLVLVASEESRAIVAEAEGQPVSGHPPPAFLVRLLTEMESRPWPAARGAQRAGRGASRERGGRHETAWRGYIACPRRRPAAFDGGASEGAVP